ncbi:DNA-binding protein [Labrenzia sp. ac12]
MKVWLTAREIAELKLDGFPGSRYGVQKLAEREGWAKTRFARRREGREGGGGLEYHVELLPLPQRAQYGAMVYREDLEGLGEKNDSTPARELPKSRGSLLDRAEDGRLRDWCLAVHAAHPDAPATRIRELAIATFGKTVSNNGQQVPMPPVRTFQNTFKKWRAEYRRAILQVRRDMRRQGRAGT